MHIQSLEDSKHSTNDEGGHLVTDGYLCQHPMASLSLQPNLPAWLPQRGWRQKDLPSVFKGLKPLAPFSGGALRGHSRDSAPALLLLSAYPAHLCSLFPAAFPLHDLHSPSRGLRRSYHLFVISIKSPRYDWNCSLFTEKTRGENNMLYGELWCRMVKCHHFSGRLIAKCTQRLFIILKVK